MEEQLFFENANALRAWLKENHHIDKVLWVCYYKKHTGKLSIIWDESVAEALCFGWIDGLRKTIDDESYRIRFTQRRKNSIWSKKNIDTVERLILEKHMTKAGLEAYGHRKEHKSAIYAYEKTANKLTSEFEKQLKDNKIAWAYYENLSPSLKKQSVNWIMSAKKNETKNKRFKTLMACSREQLLVPPLRWTKKKPDGAKR